VIDRTNSGPVDLWRADVSGPTLVSRCVLDRSIPYHGVGEGDAIVQVDGMVPDTTGRTETDPTSLIMLRSQVRFLLAPLTQPHSHTASPIQCCCAVGARLYPGSRIRWSVSQTSGRPANSLRDGRTV
jgi:hypothetical protein